VVVLAGGGKARGGGVAVRVRGGVACAAPATVAIQVRPRTACVNPQWGRPPAAKV